MAFFHIASYQTEAGDAQRALATTRTIEDAVLRSEALAKIAVAQANAGDMDGKQATLEAAVETARAIKNPAYRAFALFGIARNVRGLP